MEGPASFLWRRRGEGRAHRRPLGAALAPPPAPEARGRLPGERPRHGVVGAILWVLRTGGPWRDLPAEAGVPCRTAASRFYRWTAAGEWQKVLAELQREAEKRGGLDRYPRHFVDGSSVRATHSMDSITVR